MDKIQPRIEILKDAIYSLESYEGVTSEDAIHVHRVQYTLLRIMLLDLEGMGVDKSNEDFAKGLEAKKKFAK